MARNDHDDELDEPFRDPLPRDDRLWRHPSELDEAAEKRRSSVGKLLSSLFSRQRP